MNDDKVAESDPLPPQEGQFFACMSSIEWDDEDRELLSAATRDLRLHSNRDQGPIA